MADAFISYWRKDKTSAITLKERLEAGFEIVFDLEDIHADAGHPSIT
jgi:hypothetical protein